MTLTQNTTAPVTLAEFKAFFTENADDLTKSAKRLIATLSDDDSESDQLELYSDLYADLPKPKKVKKSDLTPEQIVEQEMAAEVELLGNIKAHAKELREKHADLYTVKGDGEQKMTVMWKCGDDIKHLNAEQKKEMNLASQKIAKIIGAVYMKKQMTPKKSSDAPDRTRVRDDADLTGGTAKVAFGLGKSKKEAVEAVIVESQDQGSHGFVIADDEAIIHDLTKGKHESHQIQMKACRRDTPINEITGCGCGVKWKFADRFFKKNAEGVYEKVKKDFGCVPCNSKVDADGKCKRHSDAKFKADWTIGDLKDCGYKIYNQ